MGALFYSNTVAAQPPPTGHVKLAPRNPAALILSGGVSLGAYEAGYLYALSEASKASDGTFSIPLLTGASAGSANAFITAINVCSPFNNRPTEDLGWQTWLPMDYRALFDKSKVTPENVLSRAPLISAFEKVRARWHQGLDESCDVVVGATVTRLKAEPIRVRRSLLVPRQEEKFVFRIRGRGPGRPPRLTNYVDPRIHLPQPLLPFVDDAGDRAKADYNLDLVRDLLFASAAFPLAFAPVKLKYCLLEINGSTSAAMDEQRCKDNLREDAFIDGGLFDNNPLRLAHDVASFGLRLQDRKMRWLSRREVLTSTISDQARPTYIYLDPDTFAYPPMETDEEMTNAPRGIVRLLSQLTSDFIATARAKELYGVVQQSMDLSDRMLLTLGNYPMASGEIGAFMGFFDREFRRFDYYLGMFDALFQAVRVAPAGSSVRQRIREFLARPIDQIPEEWRPLTCMFGYYVPGEYRRLQATCSGDDLQDFRILVQTTLDRVYSHCRALPLNAKVKIQFHPHCSDALTGGKPPTVVGVRVPSDFDYRREKDEAHLDHVLRLLARYEFWFKDLGLNRDESEYGRIKIRRKLLGMVEHIANAQEDPGDRSLLLTAGRNFVNDIAYEPPKDWWYVNGGSAIEVGTSFLPFEWNESWARLHAALQLVGAETLFAPDPIALRLSLTAGGEFEPLFISDGLLQPIIGVRAGWQVGSRDSLGTRSCNERRSLDDNRNCSQFVLHSYLALAVIERLRLQLTVEWFPIEQSGVKNNLYDVQFGFGFQFL